MPSLYLGDAVGYVQYLRGAHHRLLHMQQAQVIVHPTGLPALVNLVFVEESMVKRTDSCCCPCQWATKLLFILVRDTVAFHC
jgi:hypothetical protein